MSELENSFAASVPLLHNSGRLCLPANCLELGALGVKAELFNESAELSRYQEQVFLRVITFSPFFRVLFSDSPPSSFALLPFFNLFFRLFCRFLLQLLLPSLSDSFIFLARFLGLW